MPRRIILLYFETSVLDRELVAVIEAKRPGIDATIAGVADRRAGR